MMNSDTAMLCSCNFHPFKIWNIDGRTIKFKLLFIFCMILPSMVFAQIHQGERGIDAHNDHYSLFVNQSVTFHPLINDITSDECDSFSMFLITSPAHGLATIEDTIINYVPTAHYAGTDSLQYAICCGNACDSAWIILYISDFQSGTDTISCYGSIDLCYNLGYYLKKYSDTLFSTSYVPLVGDLDHDGHVEILTVDTGATPHHFFFSTAGQFWSTFIKYRLTVCDSSYLLPDNSISFADVDRDGYAEIFYTTPNGYLYCIKYDTLLHRYPDQYYYKVPYNSYNSYYKDPQPMLTDFNHDGIPEVMVYDRIYNAVTGILLVDGHFAQHHWNFGVGAMMPVANGTVSPSLMAIGDLDNDGLLEIAAGNMAYKVTINSLTDTSQNSISLFGQCTSMSYLGDGATALADIDLDGYLDVVVSRRVNATRDIPVCNTGQAGFFVWNPRTQSVLHPNQPLIHSYNVSTGAGPSAPSIFSFFSTTDVPPDIFFCLQDTVLAFRYNPNNLSFSNIWYINNYAYSGTNISSFDLNADEHSDFFYFTDLLNNFLHFSNNSNIFNRVYYMRADISNAYPVIADVDDENQYDVIFVCDNDYTSNTNHGKLSIFSTNNMIKYAHARKVWNQFAYSATNINEDLTIPQYPLNNATSFQDANGVIRRPYNNFLHQTGTMFTNGEPYIPFADAVLIQDSTRVEFPCDSIQITFSITNQGEVDIPAQSKVTLYVQDITNDLIQFTIDPVIAVGDTETFTFHTALAELAFIPSANDSITISYNNNGTGIAQYGQQSSECDTSNNEDKFSFKNYRVSTTTYLDSVLCAGETYDLHGFHADSTGSYNQYLQSVNGCDSIVNLALTVFDHLVNHQQDTIRLCPDDTANLLFSQSPPTIITSDTIFLPDGHSCNPYGCSYISPITFSGFADGSMINTVNDIKFLRLNIEHSYIGDLYIALTCPNGQKSTILKKYTGGSSSCSSSILPEDYGWKSGNSISYAYFGNAYDEADTSCDPTIAYNAPGIGWNYCWSNAANLGYQYAGNYGLVYMASNMQYMGSYYVDSTNMTNMSQVYHPDQSFESLIGCPINGTWQIEIIDGWSIDNGYLFEWELSLNPNLLSTAHFSGSSGLLLDTVVHPDNYSENLIFVSEDTTAPGIYNHSVVFTNQFGCTDTITVPVRVNAPITINLLDTTCQHSVYDDNGFHLTADSTASVREWYGTNYSQSQRTGCDSTTTLHLTILPTFSTSDALTIVENQLPYTWNGIIFDTAGTQTGTIAALSGCDSTITMTLTVLMNVATAADSTICESSLPLHWNDVIFTAAGTLMDTLLAHNGVDSVLTMNLHVIPNSHTTIIDTIVENQLPHIFNNIVFNDSISDTTVTIPNANGCDSIIHYSLFVYRNVTATADSTICENSLPIIWNGINFSIGGSQLDTMHNIFGADSVLTMNLHVNPNTSSTLSQTIVQNQLPYTWNSITFDTAGTQQTTIRNINGCDSSITMSLTVLMNVTATADSTICENSLPLTWNGCSFTAEGSHSVTITAHNGVDSTLLMTVHVNPNTHATVFDTIVENQLPYTFNGQAFNDSISNVIVTIANANGCDSIINYSLHVLWNTYNAVDTTICINYLPLNWHGFTYDSAGIYVDTSLNPNGTDHITTYTLSTNVLPNIEFSGINNPICPYAIGTQNITATIASGLAPYQYLWQGDRLVASSATTSTAIVNLQNMHCGDSSVNFLTVTDRNGCVASDTVILNIDDNTDPYVTGTFPVQSATVSNCVFTVPNLINLVRNQSSDNCTPRDSLIITQHPTAGDTLSGTQAVVLTITDQCNNSTTVNINVNVPATLVAVINNPTHILCNGASTGAATVTVSGGTSTFSYHWQNTSGTAISSTSAISNVPAGTYSVTVTDANGCTATTSVVLNNLNAAMNAGTIMQSQSICHGHIPTAFTGTTALGGSNSTYQWQSSINSTTFSPAVGINNNQNYTPAALTQTQFYRRAWISTSCGTVYSNVIIITVVPTFNDTIRDHICEDYPYHDHGFYLSAEENANPGTVIRTNPLQTIHGCDSVTTLILTIMPSYYDTVRASICQGQSYSGFGFNIPTDSTQNAGIFMQTQRNISFQGGCDSLTTLLLTVNPTYDILIEDETCEGKSYSGHGFMVTANETVNQTQILQMQQLHTQEGCDSVVRLQLSIIDTALLITSPQDFCDELTAELTANTTLTNYLWSTDETAQSITVNTPGTYTVTASTGNCTAFADYQISVCELQLYLPNAITPGDKNGTNDFFYINARSQSQIDKFEISIFNRWGEMVFHSTDKNFKWYGDFNNNGTIFRSNVYTYVIRCSNLQDRQYVFKGSINVL